MMQKIGKKVAQVVFTVGVLALSPLTHSQSVQNFDVKVKFNQFPNSQFDSDMNEGVAKALIAEGFKGTKITPNFVGASSQPLHIQFRIHYLYIANTNTRALVAVSAVTNRLGHEICSGDSVTWSQTQFGDGAQMRNVVRGMPADLNDWCILKVK